MVRSRTVFTWLLAAASAAAFVVGAAAQQTAGTSQGVVTPDNPLFAAQEPTPPAPPTPSEPSPQQEPAPAQTPPQVQGGRGGGRGGPRPFNQVITSEAKTDDGIFKVHRIGDTIYYEIPRSELGKDFLWVTQIKRTTLGAGYGGQEIDDRVVRWEQQGNRVFLKLVDRKSVV